MLGLPSASASSRWLSNMESWPAFSLDGSRLAVASQNNVAGQYLRRLDDVVTLAQRRLTRGLTPDECQRFLHLDHCPSWLVLCRWRSVAKSFT